MKSQLRAVFVIVLSAALAISLSACKTKKAKTGSGYDNIGGVGSVSSVNGTDMYGPEGAVSLPERPEDGQTAERASQLAPVYFDYDSSLVNPSERVKLDQVASYMKDNPSVNILIEGNTDERGSSEYNLSLGERRALAIRAYIIGLGIDGSRLQTKSNGKEKPVTTGHDEASWAQNRRAEFFILH